MYKVVGHADRGRSCRVIQDDDDMDAGNHSLSGFESPVQPDPMELLVDE